MQEPNIRALYYITHIDNLPSILSQGVLSHARVRTESIQDTTIYLPHLVNKRRKRRTSDGKNLWHYANLFFQPRNPMLFKLIKSKGKQNLTVLRISNTVLRKQGIFITDGIASNKLTHIYSQSEGLDVLQTQQVMLQSGAWVTQQVMLQSGAWVSWNHSDKIRRQLMTECLVPNQVNPKDIQQFIVADQAVSNSLRIGLSSTNVQKIVVATDRNSNIFTPFS